MAKLSAPAACASSYKCQKSTHPSQNPNSCAALPKPPRTARQFRKPASAESRHRFPLSCWGQLAGQVPVHWRPEEAWFLMLEQRILRCRRRWA